VKSFVSSKVDSVEADEETNITPSSEQCLECGYAIGTFEQEIGLAKAVFPSFSLRIPKDAPS